MIIDEISMCRFDLFVYVARRIQYENDERRKDRMAVERAMVTGYMPKEYEEYPVKEKDLQLIVLGDFFQLPPVISKDDKQELDMAYAFDYGQGYAFMSAYWKMMNFKGVALTQIIRQEDAEFKNVLSAIRHGNKKDMASCIDFLKRNSSDFPMVGDDAINLIPINDKCKDFNDKELAKLETEEEIYYSISKGEVRASDKFAEDEIVLKEGCKVMTTVNASNGDYVNGTMGIVKKLRDGSVDVLTEKEKLITIGMISREITKPVESTKTVTKYVDEAVLDEDGLPKKDDEGRVIFKKVLKEVEEKTISHETVGSYSQLPLKIAYAITVHKSQGKTFSRVNIDPYAWDYGQFYTALSRAKRIENVCFFQEINPKWIKTSPDAKQFMKGIEKASKGILGV